MIPALPPAPPRSGRSRRGRSRGSASARGTTHTHPPHGLQRARREHPRQREPPGLTRSRHHDGRRAQHRPQREEPGNPPGRRVRHPARGVRPARPPDDDAGDRAERTRGSATTSKDPRRTPTAAPRYRSTPAVAPTPCGRPNIRTRSRRPRRRPRHHAIGGPPATADRDLADPQEDHPQHEGLDPAPTSTRSAAADSARRCARSSPPRRGQEPILHVAERRPRLLGDRAVHRLGIDRPHHGQDADQGHGSGRQQATEHTEQVTDRAHRGGAPPCDGRTHGEEERREHEEDVDAARDPPNQTWYDTTSKMATARSPSTSRRYAQRPSVPRAGHRAVGDPRSDARGHHASWLFHIDRAEPMAMCMSRYW